MALDALNQHLTHRPRGREDTPILPPADSPRKNSPQIHPTKTMKPKNRFLLPTFLALSSVALTLLAKVTAAEPPCASCSQPSAAGSVATLPATTSPTDPLQQRWGIEIASLRLSAQGSFVDFRYRVLDAEKAAPLSSHDWRPYLIDQQTGNRLSVPSTPKLGALRQTAQRLTPGRIYYIFFGNGQGLVKAGSKVTVVVGDCRIENLTVE